MNKIILLTIAIAGSVALQAQQLFSKRQLEVQQTVVKMFEALSNRDSVTLQSFCSPDITFYEYGQIWNMDTLIRKGITMNRLADFKRINTFDFINIETDRTTAWVTYRLNSVITRDAKQSVMQWLETVVLSRQKKQWKINHLHSTLINKAQ